MEDQKVKKTFWQFLAGFFRDDEPESMNRLLSLIFGLASVAFGILTIIMLNKHPKVLESPMLWLSIGFAVLALVNKNISKLIEILLSKVKAVDIKKG